jgi:isoleucyl-tRNA synthetase
MERNGERWILADNAVERYARELRDFVSVGTVKGASLVGHRYQPLFSYFADAANSFVVLAADFVNAEDGTGIVHIAPGFGEDDLEVGKAQDLPIVVPVDFAGRFIGEVSDYAGQNIFDANANIIRDLKARNVVVRHQQYKHNYPHCWRTDEPLIYMAIDSWYIAVGKFKERMVELNKDIKWVPEHIREGLFGNWLANARDWNISRNRFWGTPVPIWKSSDPRYPRVDVYGSLDEIERDFGVRPTDLHRPAFDPLTRLNPDDLTGQSIMRRIPDVLDLLVRIRRHAVRAAALSPRKQGALRGELPGRLHPGFEFCRPRSPPLRHWLAGGLMRCAMETAAESTAGRWPGNPRTGPQTAEQAPAPRTSGQRRGRRAT